MGITNENTRYIHVEYDSGNKANMRLRDWHDELETAMFHLSLTLFWMRTIDDFSFFSFHRTKDGIFLQHVIQDLPPRRVISFPSLDCIPLFCQPKHHWYDCRYKMQQWLLPKKSRVRHFTYVENDLSKDYEGRVHTVIMTYTRGFII